MVDGDLSSRTMSFHILDHIPFVVVEAEAASGIVMVEVASVRCFDYLVGGRVDWVAAVGFLYQRNS